MLLSFLLQIVSVLYTRENCRFEEHYFFKGTHYAIARYAIERDLHVLVTKPATQLLSHHLELIDLSRKHNVVCFVEHHKRCVPFSPCHESLPYHSHGDLVLLRYDPVYSDARVRARDLGEFNFFNAWMSQPKSQLETFRAWAGRDSDIR
jgi:D-galacturonate reductase